MTETKQFDMEKECQVQPFGDFRVGQRVKVVFACPTAAKCHEDSLGLTGTVRVVRIKPMWGKNVWGNYYLRKEGPIEVRFDIRQRKEYSGGSAREWQVEWLFPWELEKLGED